MPRPGRNPLRAYDKDGREIAPMTVASVRRLGCSSIMAFCGECQHKAAVPVDPFPDDFPAPDIALRLRCSACGSKRVSTQINVSEIYEAWYARPA